MCIAAEFCHARTIIIQTSDHSLNTQNATRGIVVCFRAGKARCSGLVEKLNPPIHINIRQPGNEAIRSSAQTRTRLVGDD